MNMVRYRPFDDLFRSFAQIGEPLERDTWRPLVDIFETAEAYEIHLEIPSVARDDIAVEVKDGVLTVSGERKREERAEGRNHRVERVFGRFARSFRLPENADEENISAAFESGVLRLIVSKAEKAKPRQIEVQVH